MSDIFCTLLLGLSTVHANMNKTNVMISGESRKGVYNTERWPCGVCGRGVGRNSVQCTKCQVVLEKRPLNRCTTSSGGGGGHGRGRGSGSSSSSSRGVRSGCTGSVVV